MANPDNGDRRGDLMQLLDELQEEIIELEAIKQAATDYITLNEVIRPIPGKILDEKINAYKYLKSLVYE